MAAFSSKLPIFGSHAPPCQHSPACPSRRSFPGIRGHPSHSDGRTGLHTGCTCRQKIHLEPQRKGGGLDLYTEFNTDPAPSATFLQAPKGCKTPQGFLPFCFNLLDTTLLPSQHPFHRKRCRLCWKIMPRTSHALQPAARGCVPRKALQGGHRGSSGALSTIPSLRATHSMKHSSRELW